MMSIGKTILSLRKHINHLVPHILIPRPTTHLIIRKMSESKESLLTLDQEAMRIVWMDLEMTGLDPDTDKILELTCAITDSELRLIDQYEVVIHQSDKVLDNMNDWCQNQHKKTGLVDRVRESKVSLIEAEAKTLEFIKSYTMPQCSPLAGNSVHMDKFFLMKQMPQITNYLHYRIIDVSTIKELAKRWNDPIFKQANAMKKNQHRAKEDILESIEELRLYKKHFLTNHSLYR